MKNQNQLPKVTEIDIVYRSRVKAADRPKVKCSEDANDIFMSVFDPLKVGHKEMMYCMYLSQQNRVLGVLKVAECNINACLADTRIILQGALKLNATAMILCHNHPSGNLKPSQSDIQLTRKVKDAAQVMDIQLLDQIIVTPEEEFYSLADNGQV